MKTKKIPMRMCVGCREMKEKKSLVRVVRTTEGEIRMDPTGKMNGRGAYVCPDPACLEKAVRQKQLERALEARIDESVLSRLQEAVRDHQ